MKHIPSILDYLLVLDYAVATNQLQPTKPGDENTGVEKRGTIVKDDYFWVEHEEYWYKTPFRADKYLQQNSVDKSQLVGLLDLWIDQYTTLFRKYSEIRYGFIPTLEAGGLIYEEYVQCLLDYAVGTCFASRTTENNNIVYLPIRFDNIDLSVITVTSSNGVQVDPIDVTGFLGCGGIYLFDSGKNYDVTIDNTSVTLEGSVYKGLLVGFLIKTEYVPFCTIEQLVNNGWVLTTYTKSGPNSQDTIPTSAISVKLYQFIAQNALGTVIEPYIFGILRNQKSSSLDIVFSSYIDNLTKMVPTYFSIDPNFNVSFKPIIESLGVSGIKLSDFDDLTDSGQISRLSNPLRSKIISVLETLSGVYTRLDYNIFTKSLETTHFDTKGLFLTSLNMIDLIEMNRQFFGQKVKADVYKGLVIKRVGSPDTLLESDKFETWRNKADIERK